MVGGFEGDKGGVKQSDNEAMLDSKHRVVGKLNKSREMHCLCHCQKSSYTLVNTHVNNGYIDIIYFI